MKYTSVQKEVFLKGDLTFPYKYGDFVSVMCPGGETEHKHNNKDQTTRDCKDFFKATSASLSAY